MVEFVRKTLHEKFGKLRDLAMECTSFETKVVEQVLTPQTLYKIKQLNEAETSKFKKEMEDFIDTTVGEIVNQEVNKVDEQDSNKARLSEENYVKYLKEQSVKNISARVTKEIVEKMGDRITGYWK